VKVSIWSSFSGRRILARKEGAFELLCFNIESRVYFVSVHRHGGMLAQKPDIIGHDWLLQEIGMEKDVDVLVSVPFPPFYSFKSVC
jgi:hypothetical protein